VLLILGILAAVVVVNVVGLTGRGEAESYAVDERTIQLSVSTFYSDAHGYSNTDGWNEAGNYTSVHNYPTATGTGSTLHLGNETAMGKYTVQVVMDSSDGMPATTGDITAAAIWMGLLVNGAGQCDVTGAGPDVAPGDNNSPLAEEHGPYLNPLPRSCSRLNSSSGTGTITWIVGQYNRIYGVFESGGLWYAGFGGRYP
jgi:type II secretory pathway pseudopilin PulG